MRLYEESPLLSSDKLMKMALDAEGPAHDPSTGQFTSGPGGTGGEHPASKAARVMRARSDVTSARAKASGKPNSHVVAHQDANAAHKHHTFAASAAGGLGYHEAANYHTAEADKMRTRSQEHYERSRKDK
jgi:hypothetical protein